MTASRGNRAARPGGLNQAARVALIAGFMALSAAYVWRTPLWQAPDEPAHFNYVLHVAQERTLPELRQGDWNSDLLAALTSARFPPDRDVAPLRYEFHQPPLYYLLSAPVAAALADRPLSIQLRALRLVSAGWSALTLLCVLWLARLVFPGQPRLGLFAAATIGGLPQFVAMSAAVNNDSLAILVMTLTLCACAARLSGHATGIASPAGLGALAGIAFLTKTTIYAAAPLVALALVYAPVQRGSGRPVRDLARRWTMAGAAALLVSGWWFVRNAAVYGALDPFGLARHAETVTGQPLTGPVDAELALRWLGTLFRSFWFQLGWMAAPAPDPVYLALAAVCAVAAAGLGLRLFNASHAPLPSRRPWQAAGLLTLTVLTVFGQTALYNLTFYQPQGRYLFPALAPLALAFSAGLGETITPRYHLAAGVAWLAFLAWLNGFALLRALPYLAP